MKKNINPLFFLFMVLLFVSCPEPEKATPKSSDDQKEKPPKVLHWTFQEKIPGWLEFDNNNTPDYPAGTTMNLDAVLPNGMTLLASGRTTRWVPTHEAPVNSDFSDGYIQPNGATAAGRYSLKIEKVTGPFTIVVNYTAREGQKSSPVIFIDGIEVKKGNESDGEFDPLSVDYEYSDNDTVTVQLSNVNGGIRIYDVIITIKGSSGNQILVNRIAINVGDFFLETGGTRQLSANVFPGTATNKNVNWSSDNTGIVTVNSAGLVTALAEGTAHIIAEAKDGSGKSDSITVTVRPPAEGMTTPQQIFDALRGLKVTTNGWADIYNNSAGITYMNPAAFTLIDDASYPNPADKRTAFTDAIGTEEARFIIVSGDIDLSDGKITNSDKSWFNQFDANPPYGRLHGDITFNLRGNTSIIGINNARLMFGGLVIRNGSSNIIIRNIIFWDAHGSTSNDTGKSGYGDAKASATALQVENNPGGSGIWVDHCTFTDGTCVDLSRNYNHDGAFDIKYGRYITVSWCEFTNHDKVMLVGSNDNTTGAITYLSPTERQITLHHNYFHGTTQRMPRTRGTQMHVYNNYYDNIGTAENGGAFMGPGYNAQFIVENNYFGSKAGSKNFEWMDTSAYPAKVFYTGNNKADNDTGWYGRASDSVKPWTPAYTYAPEPYSGLPASVPAAAGPTLNLGN